MPGNRLAPPVRMGRAVVIVNPRASRFHPSLEQRLLDDLGTVFTVDTVRTTREFGAGEIAARALAEGDAAVVITLGGDGTANEAAQALAGSELPLVPLPGGSTNVFSRTLGYPNDPAAAAKRVVEGKVRRRRVDVGRVRAGEHTDRLFLFSAGIGVDASVVQRVDRHPALKAMAKGSFFAAVAVATITTRYIGRSPLLAAEVDGVQYRGVTAAFQTATPSPTTGLVLCAWSHTHALTTAV